MPDGSPRQEIRTFKLRRSRVTGAQAAALQALAPQFLIGEGSDTINLGSSLNRQLFIMDIGFGMGEATLANAVQYPQTAVLSLDVHTPGIGRLLNLLNDNGIENVRVMEADALEVMRIRIEYATLDGVRLFFPDPWPKTRHHKRRFIISSNLTLVASKVKVGGFFHLATDIENYAEQAIEELTAHPHWKLLPLGEGVEAAQPQERPRTRFEQRGLDAGRAITDIVAIRC